MSSNTRRFDGFQASPGMARSVLTARLRKLTGQGVLGRHRYCHGELSAANTRSEPGPGVLAAG